MNVSVCHDLPVVGPDMRRTLDVKSEFPSLSLRIDEVMVTESNVVSSTDFPSTIMDGSRHRASFRLGVRSNKSPMVSWMSTDFSAGEPIE
jgi:hypothetical protein